MNDSTPITYEGEAPDDGWSKVPHGLWTHPGLNPQARLVLGWLHSHHPHFRARLTLRTLRREFGTGGATRSLTALKAAGLLAVHRDGKQARIVLDVPAYFAMGRVAPSGVHQAEEGGTQWGPPGGTQWGPLVAPSGVREEEHEKTKGEEHPPSLRDAPQGAGVALVARDAFDAWWDLYPRKVGKPDARKAHKAALAKRGVTAADLLRGLEPWLAYWTVRNEPGYVPYPGTWLRQERWNDTRYLPDESLDPARPSRMATGMDVLRRGHAAAVARQTAQEAAGATNPTRPALAPHTTHPDALEARCHD